MWPFDDVLSAVNSGYQFLTGLPATIAGFFVALATIIFYPVVLIVNLIYRDIDQAYSVAVGLVNIIISIPNLVSSTFSSWLPSGFPSIWTVFFLMSVSLGVFLRVQRIINYVRGWIPILWG